MNQGRQDMVEGTEAVKHSLFLRGYFKHRGYFNLAGLSAEEYRKNKRFSAPQKRREWLQGSDLFQANAHHGESLSPAGKARIDGVVTAWSDSFGNSPLILGGYAANGTASDQMSVARSRALMVREYIRSRYRLDGQMIAVQALGSQPPPGPGRDHWDGLSVLLLSANRP